MSEEIKIERRKSGTLSNIIGVLFTIILGGLTWWMAKIDAKADRVPILEERLTGMAKSLDRIEIGMIDLLKKK